MKRLIDSKKYLNNVIEINQEEQNPPDPELLELMAKNWEKIGDKKMTLGTLELSAKLHDSTDSLRKIIKNLRKPGDAEKTLPYLKKLLKQYGVKFIKELIKPLIQDYQIKQKPFLQCNPYMQISKNCFCLHY